MNIVRKLIQKIKDNRIELLTLSCLLLIAAIAHGYNMFHYPYYENDEGTYMSQAWSLLNEGKLAPYTYWYDHAPFGWIVIAGWTLVTGGFFTFGPAVNSGRVFMLVVHLASSVLLFYIAKRLTKGTFAGIIAVLIFALTPLGIYYQRRVLLDNIMIFWVLSSLYILLKEKITLRDSIASGVIFGISILTKENAVFFVPAFLYVIYSKSHKHSRSFALVTWLTVTGLVVGFYFLYALLKGELLPTGFMGDTREHVSLLATLQAQLGRGSGLPFWNHQSDFYLTMIEWISRDPLTIFGGAIITILNIILCIKIKALRVPVLFALFFWLFLMRGKLVINFYIIPLISLLALNIGIFADVLVQKFARNNIKTYQTLILVLITVLIVTFLRHDTSPYTKDETTPQLEALQWVFDNVPKTSVIAIDDFADVDYRVKGYTNAFWFWKISLDSEVQRKFQNDWQNINYIYLSHEMLKQMSSNPNQHQMLLSAFRHSDQQVFFEPSKTTFLDIKKYQTTNGDWAAIYKVQSHEEIAFDNAWTYYKQNFIHSYGQVIDPQTGNTTSEGQSYALLRSVWVNDREMFDNVWQWTRDHIEYRSEDRLFSWLWKNDRDNGYVGDTASASDADLDIALSLILADRRWNDRTYSDEAFNIIDDIWQKEVVMVKGHYYLTAGSGAERANGYLLNPSYFSPAAYRLFAEIDRRHPWNTLADDTYIALKQLSDPQTGLPPNWVLLTKEGTCISAHEYVSGSEVDSYSFDAFRTFFRVAIDAMWFDSPQAFQYLNTVRPFFQKEWESKHKIFSVYETSGQPSASFESLSTTIGALSVFEITDQKKSKELFDEKIQAAFNETGYWGEPSNYYNQNWAWFGDALHSGVIKKF